MSNFNLNKVILGGRLTQDPEFKLTPQGMAVTSFSVAVKRKGKEEATDFINCVAWRQTAEFVCNYFKKGSSICIAGNIQTRTWTDKDNTKRYATEVIVDEAYFVDSKSDNTSADIKNVPSFQTQPSPKFEEVPDDEDLPF